MPKQRKRYLDIDPWIIRETGFHADRAATSESLFALANERMGVRGGFEEGFTGPGMPGHYFNGIYEKGKHQYSTRFKGFAEHWTYMVNGPDWLHTRISLDNEPLDLARCRFTDFIRQIDMRRGILERSFTWESNSGKRLRLRFERFLSMADTRLGAQRITATPLNFSAPLEITLGIDYTSLYHLRQTRPWTMPRAESPGKWSAALGALPSSGHRVFSAFRIHSSHPAEEKCLEEERRITRRLTLELKRDEPVQVERIAIHHPEKDSALEDERVWQAGWQELRERHDTDYNSAETSQLKFWEDFWAGHDIAIEGDPENQQGFRYGIFHLTQTYNGADPHCNVGAKGLTGEHYWGVTWWDTETYCLPYYLFNNHHAARNLVDYRHRTLEGARQRARELQLTGARYPMCTIDGEEVCDVWQHGDLEIHVSAAVAYGVWKYHHLTRDDDFLFEKGADILVEVARFYAARGDWGQQTGRFGFWGVMGADEMHLMVHNNAYTNFMAKKSFEWALQTLERMQREAPERFHALVERLHIDPTERIDWQRKADAMELMHNSESGLYEQHEGYFNMPHIDYQAIPDEQFPVQKTWPYVDLFRFDLIKQPDVLLFFHLFSTEFDQKTLRSNYEFYEPRCSHESSLSPAIHSILAARLGKHEQAFDYARYASRLDLDDYNNNTWEGLHVTSMAGAWMNLVYGFGGLQSDGPALQFHPVCPEQWKAVHFQLHLDAQRILSVRIHPDGASFQMNPGATADLIVYGQKITVNQTPVGIKRPLP